MLITNKTEVSVNPRELVIFSPAKSGKTTAISGLQDSLIIDTEDGTQYVTGTIVNILAICGQRLNCKPKEVLDHPNGCETFITVLQEVVAEVKAANTTFKYVIIDTVTNLIPVATYLGTLMYKKLPIGKNYTGTDVVRDLAQGAGYMFLQQAFQKIMSIIRPIASECLIQDCHVKDASINKDGKELSARDLQLPGKMRQIVCQNADAIGLMYRKDGCKTMISFKSDERDLATGARPAHLANQEFVLVEEEPKGSRKFVFHWDKIFLA